MPLQASGRSWWRRLNLGDRDVGVWLCPSEHLATWATGNSRGGRGKQTTSAKQCNVTNNCTAVKPKVKQQMVGNTMCGQAWPLQLAFLAYPTTLLRNIWILKVISWKKCIKTVDELVGCDPKWLLNVNIACKYIWCQDMNSQWVRNIAPNPVYYDLHTKSRIMCARGKHCEENYFQHSCQTWSASGKGEQRENEGLWRKQKGIGFIASLDLQRSS